MKYEIQLIDLKIGRLNDEVFNLQLLYKNVNILRLNSKKKVVKKLWTPILSPTVITS